MTVKYGQQGLDTQLSTNRYFDITEEIFLLHPDETPFTALMVGLKRAVVGDSDFRWFNKDKRSKATTTDAASLTGSTTISVVDATMFVPADIIRVIDQTSKALLATHRITAVNTTTNDLTVVRAVAGTDANIASGDTILRIGNAQIEGSLIPESVQQEMVQYYNYTQIIRHSSKYTRSLFESNKFHAGNIKKELQTNREEKRLEHTEEVETVLMFGQRAIEGAGTNAVRRYTGGLDYWLGVSATAGTENRIDVAGAGAITLTILRSFLDTYAFKYGSHEKWAFASSEVIGILCNLVKDFVRVKDQETSFGLKVTTFEFTSGTLHMVRHDLMRYGVYANAMMVIDPAHLQLKFLGQSMSRFKSDVGLASTDAFEDSWLTDVGLMCAVPQTLARLGNIVSS